MDKLDKSHEYLLTSWNRLVSRWRDNPTEIDRWDRIVLLRAGFVMPWQTAKGM